MRLLIFGGTTEGRVLADRANALGAEVTVSVATETGAEDLAGVDGVRVLTGRLDRSGMEALLPGFDLCMDATHPYAKLATAAIRAACESTGVPRLRLLRPASQIEGAVCVPDCKSAAAFLADRPGNILLTTGSKELSAFAGLGPGRVYARVLPTHGGIAACEALGLSHSHILALQGPFSRKLNEAVLEQYQIRWLVTKDGGQAGGFGEKLAAAQNTGAELAFFSPIRDRGLPPDADGLYLPGGYPELYARQLSENASMRESVRQAAAAGLPTVAECGGFLYLQKTLEDDEGQPWPMVGLLPGAGYKTDHLQRFGYKDLRAEADSLLFRKGETVPAHEFHYWDCTEPNVVLTETLYAGFPHLHFGGELPLAQRFVEGAVKWREEHER